MLEHFFHSEVFTITFVIGLYLINIKIHRWCKYLYCTRCCTLCW